MSVGEALHVNHDQVLQSIDGHPENKNLLSIGQFTADDIDLYLQQAYAAQDILTRSGGRGVSLVPFFELKAVMRQASTRTGGSITTAMRKLGGSAELISGMASSSENKGESLPDSWVAFATQSDIIGTRTEEEFGPHAAASAIETAFNAAHLSRNVPVINLGDGRNEHPTQALGDLFTINKNFDSLDDKVITIVGDQERYRAHHSLILGAFVMGMNVVAVQAEISKVPSQYVDLLGDKLTITDDLDNAMRQTDILYLGRNPDEYDGDDVNEKERSRKMAEMYDSWVVNRSRLQLMRNGSIVLHPRPRRNELNPDVDNDPRMRDVQQMANMIPMRMAILALHLGFKIPRLDR